MIGLKSFKLNNNDLRMLKKEKLSEGKSVCGEN
jgi:hypothetical protein